MKSKFFALLAVLGLATASQAATFDIYITGSTAGRASVHDALAAIMTSETVTWSGNSSLNSAGRANFFGGVIGANTYNVYCSWSGSATGIQALTQNLNVAFQTETSPAGQIVTPGAFTNHTADIAFSDVFQSSTNFRTPALTRQADLVLPFKIFASEGAPITNITPQQLQVLFGTGAVPLAFFTGNNADHDVGVFASGRDNGSGTRITTFAEAGLGAFAVTNQFQPTLFPVTNTTTNAHNFLIAAATTTTGSPVVTHTGTGPVVGQPIRGTTIPAGAVVQSVGSGTFTMNVNANAPGGTPGNIRAGQVATAITDINDGGASSGGDVATYVAAVTTGLLPNPADYPGFTEGAYLVSYLGISDGNTAITNGGVEVPYNGYTYSENDLYEGRYTLWGYLHQFRRTSPAAGVANLFTAVRAQLLLVPGPSGLDLDNMQVERQADGANVTPLY